MQILGLTGCIAGRLCVFLAFGHETRERGTRKFLRALHVSWRTGRDGTL